MTFIEHFRPWLPGENPEGNPRKTAAERFGDRLRLLGEFGLTDRDIAKATGASTRSVRRWRTEGPPATKISERWEPIDDLFTIIGFLLATGSYDNEGVVAWLRSRHRALDNRRPLDVLGEENFPAVIGAAEQTLTPRGVPEEDSFFAIHPGHRADTPPDGWKYDRAKKLPTED